MSPNMSFSSEKTRSAAAELGDNAHRERPCGEVLAMVGPEEEDAVRERGDVVVIDGSARALGEVCRRRRSRHRASDEDNHSMHSSSHSARREYSSEDECPSEDSWTNQGLLRGQDAG